MKIAYQPLLSSTKCSSLCVTETECCLTTAASMFTSAMSLTWGMWCQEAHTIIYTQEEQNLLTITATLRPS